MKESILAATDGGVSTIKTTKHDVYQSTDVFPRQYDGRAIIGISYNESQSGESDEDIIRRYKEAKEKGEDQRRTVWAYVLCPFDKGYRLPGKLTHVRRGTGVGVIDQILSVDELFKSIQQEAKLAVARVMERI